MGVERRGFGMQDLGCEGNKRNVSDDGEVSPYRIGLVTEDEEDDWGFVTGLKWVCNGSGKGVF